MATLPDLGEFLSRFPAFRSVDTLALNLHLEDAGAAFTPEPFSTEYMWKRAVMLLAAHRLTQAGYGTGVEAALSAAGMGGFSSVSDGAVSASRPTGASETIGYGSTSYGRELKALLRNSLPRAVVIADPLAVGYTRGSPNQRRD